jgi:hypothetical protein
MESRKRKSWAARRFGSAVQAVLTLLKELGGQKMQTVDMLQTGDVLHPHLTKSVSSISEKVFGEQSHPRAWLQKIAEVVSFLQEGTKRQDAPDARLKCLGFEQCLGSNSRIFKVDKE